MPSLLSRQHILDDISAERERQTALKAMGQFKREVHELGASDALAVLAEEFGEVANVVADMVAGKPLETDHLREELIQVAAVCVSWVEGIDAQQKQPPMQSGCGLYATRPKPPVIIYDEPCQSLPSDVYTDEELADWNRDPELSA